MNILVTMPCGFIRDTFLTKDVVQQLSGLGHVAWNTGDRQWSPEELQELLADTDICVTGWGTQRFDEVVLRKADRLKLVAHTGGTVATIVTPEFYERGIRIVSGNDAYARSVAEGVIAYILLSLRRLPYFMEKLEQTGWVMPQYLNEGLLDQTVGLVGYGSVAKHLVPMLRAFHAKIKIYSSHLTAEQAGALGIQKATLEEVMSTCKVVSLHSASTPATYHMINRELLGLMQRGSLLVNTSRGEILDEAALVEVCRDRGVSAVLDVYEEEDPLPKTSPLWGQPNILKIPHMAGPTVDQRRTVGLRLVNEIRRYINGEDLTMEIDAAAAERMTRK